MKCRLTAAARFSAFLLKLRAALLTAVDEGPGTVVVDMAGVEWIDSTGLGTLVGALKRARAKDGTVRVAGAPNRITDALPARQPGTHRPAPQSAQPTGDPLDHAWHLLASTCDLPATEAALLKVLTEYRKALHALATHVSETRR